MVASLPLGSLMGEEFLPGVRIRKQIPWEYPLDPDSLCKWDTGELNVYVFGGKPKYSAHALENRARIMTVNKARLRSLLKRRIFVDTACWAS
jgi:hypothetical protein